MARNDFWNTALGVSTGEVKCPHCQSKATFSGAPTLVNIAIKEFITLHETCRTPREKSTVSCRHCRATFDAKTTIHDCMGYERPCNEMGGGSTGLDTADDFAMYCGKSDRHEGPHSYEENQEFPKAEQKLKARRCTRSEGHDGPCNGFPCPARETELIDRMLGKKTSKPPDPGQTPRKKSKYYSLKETLLFLPLRDWITGRDILEEQNPR